MRLSHLSFVPCMGLACALTFAAGCSATKVATETGNETDQVVTAVSNETVEANATAQDDLFLWYTNDFFSLQAQLPKGFVEDVADEVSNGNETCELYANDGDTGERVAIYLRDDPPEDVEEWMGEFEQSVSTEVEFSERRDITLGGAACVNFSYTTGGDDAPRLCEHFFIVKNDHGLRIDLVSGDEDGLVALENCFASYVG